MKLLLFLSVVVYLVMTRHLFKLWLKFLQRDTSRSPEENSLSWAILIVGSLFWPIVVPICYLALLQKKLEHQEVTLKEHELINAAYYRNNPLSTIIENATFN
ncbi:MAG TPA: hypothetical protein DCP31_37235 [Cyanobacteria bacterium UBA8543]|nr:hypothetical protein [Cyanobacteria bacterium UBA8543]